MGGWHLCLCEVLKGWQRRVASETPLQHLGSNDLFEPFLMGVIHKYLTLPQLLLTEEQPLSLKHQNDPFFIHMDDHMMFFLSQNTHLEVIDRRVSSSEPVGAWSVQGYIISVAWCEKSRRFAILFDKFGNRWVSVSTLDNQEQCTFAVDSHDDLDNGGLTLDPLGRYIIVWHSSTVRQYSWQGKPLREWNCRTYWFAFARVKSIHHDTFSRTSYIVSPHGYVIHLNLNTFQVKRGFVLKNLHAVNLSSLIFNEAYQCFTLVRGDLVEFFDTGGHLVCAKPLGFSNPHLSKQRHLVWVEPDFTRYGVFEWSAK